MTNRLFEALEDHFDDIDDVKDIARYGLSGGKNGFIYTGEIRDWFLKYEDEIEGLMFEYGVSYNDLNPSRDQWINDYITAAVWWAVEHWACDKMYTLENELDEEYALANAY